MSMEQSYFLFLFPATKSCISHGSGTEREQKRLYWGKYSIFIMKTEKPLFKGSMMLWSGYKGWFWTFIQAMCPIEFILDGPSWLQGLLCLSRDLGIVWCFMIVKSKPYTHTHTHTHTHTYGISCHLAMPCPHADESVWKFYNTVRLLVASKTKKM